MGELIRSFNWSATPLGDPGQWPSALKIAVGIMLGSPFPMHITWGDQFIQLYNDGYRPVLGESKHPQALGQPIWLSFPEIWDTVGPMFQGVMEGKAVRFPDFKLILERNGYPEECYFDFAYSPIIDEDGKVHGVLTNEIETTEKVMTQKSLAKERDRLWHFFMQAPAGICIMGGPELVFELVNPSYQQLFPGRKLLGKPLFDAVPEVRDQPIWDVLQNVYTTGKTFEGNELLIPLARTDDGQVEERYFNFIYQARKDENGKPDGILVFVIEVTDLVIVRKKAERAEESLRMAIDAAELGSYYINTADRIFHPSPRIKEFFGFNPDEEVPYEAAINQIHEDYRQAAADLVEASITQGIRFDMEYPVVGYHDGKIRWVRGLGEVQHYGGKSYFTGVLHEITEQKLTEGQIDIYTKELQTINEELTATNEELATTNEELSETQQELQQTNQELATSESRLRMAIESTKLGTWEYRPVTGELYWSKECRNIYGIAANQAATFETFSEHIYPQDRPWVQEEIQKCLNPDNGGRYDLSYRIIRFDNQEIRWIKVQGTVYFDQKQANLFIGTVLDITEIKEAEEKSAKLAAIIESSDDAIISKTLESVITSWNNSAQRMFGYTADEIIGQTIYKLIPPDRQNEEPHILSRLKSGERVEHFETKRMTKDGKLIDVSLTISPIKDAQGQIIGLSKIARDITERKLDETRKNDFIGMVSHELKTPLTSLTAMLQVAQVKLKNSGDSFLAGAMQKANQQAKRMSAMINGFLNISRFESGKIQIEKQVFDLEGLILEVVEEMQLIASTHLIHFMSSKPVQVMADRDKISSVISNLISNAVKYSPKGKNIEVKCVAGDKNVVVSIKDEGIGIKPQDAEMIFDRYYRVKTVHTQHISGFGIGLYLSAEIVRRHDGNIWVESESGKGSTFYFSLPL